eukprot:TRINITY_DN3107_c0_g1_i3.p1 TRINITY_DN3107_c0_g1~~TRINITY_DN3107_c0_g1_i3.p1  ORF type:complete len:263 (+),score=61.30 TRINITY_DN3107_c0_g1_i3:49-837(+)
MRTGNMLTLDRLLPNLKGGDPEKDGSRYGSLFHFLDGSFVLGVGENPLMQKVERIEKRLEASVINSNQETQVASKLPSEVHSFALDRVPRRPRVKANLRQSRTAYPAKADLVKVPDEDKETSPAPSFSESHWRRKDNKVSMYNKSESRKRLLARRQGEGEDDDDRGLSLTGIGNMSFGFGMPHARNKLGETTTKLKKEHHLLRALQAAKDDDEEHSYAKRREENLQRLYDGLEKVRKGENVSKLYRISNAVGAVVMNDGRDG